MKQFNNCNYMLSENLSQEEKDNNIKEEENPGEGKFDNNVDKEHNNGRGESEEKDNTDTEETNAEEDEEELEDVVFEEEESYGDQVKKLREKLKECRREKSEYLAALQRLRADYANQRSRAEEEKIKTTEDTKDKFIKDLLLVIDSFEIAFADSNVWETVDKKWREGVEQIYSQFLSFLQNHGVEQLNSLGEEFDPHLHEPVATVPVEEQNNDNKVVEVLQRGYIRGDKVIRPAKVNVGKYS